MNFLSACLLLFGVSLAQAADTPGIKMTIEYGSPRNGSRRTIYFQADRKRFEYQNSFGQRQADGSARPIYGPRIVSITRCDLGQAFTLNLDTHEYTATPYPPKPFTKEEMEKRGLSSITYVSDKPTLRIETTTRDTGERKEIFGRMARHVITTRKQTPLEGSVSQGQESVTDGWYIDSTVADSDIDLSQRLSCDRKRPGKKAHAYLHAGNGTRPMDRPEFVDIGDPETGFAVESVTTSTVTYTSSDGTKKQRELKNEMRVKEIEKVSLDPALFEIPEGFKPVDHIEHNPPQSAFPNPPTNVWQEAWRSGVSFFR
jgi:hypothetical protein